MEIKLKRIVLIFCLALMATSGKAATLYVSNQGDDNATGKSIQNAFKTLQKAANVANPGDVVIIAGGVYELEGKPDGRNVLNITRSGKPEAWVTWKAMAGQHPVIHPTGWAAIQIGASYQILDGLTIIGNNDGIVLMDALNDAKKPKPDPYFNTNGIFVNGRNLGPGEKPHHVIIRNCEVGKCAGGGIVAIEADHITVEDCKVHENAWFMRYGGSGITTLDNWAFDDAPGYHTVIQRNYVWNNKTMVPWEQVGRLSDGNGIILDVTDQEQSQGATNPNGDAVVKPAEDLIKNQKPKRPVWKSRALVANNFCAYNGGSGIHTFRTAHVDIVNNTTYWNGSNVGYPELFANTSEDIVIINNIIVPRPAGKVTSNHNNKIIRWDFNLYPISQDVLKGIHDIISDPQFISVNADPTQGGFRLKKSSPAFHSGSNELLQPAAIDHKRRPKDSEPDRGAFQH